MFVHDCAPFIRRIKNFSQVILKYTIIMSHSKSESDFGYGIGFQFFNGRIRSLES